MFDLLMHAAPSAWRRAREPLVRALLARRGAARTVNGIPLRVDPVGRHVFTPIYDEGVAAYLRTHLREGMEAWNVGANIGVYALQLAHLVGAAGRVVAFEPNPAAREVLGRNIGRNSLQSRVEVVPSAVGSAPGTVDFYTSGADGMGRAGRPNPQLSATDRIEVPVTTLDAFASARGRLPDLVVMDIEGWEIAALEGARSHLGRTRFIVELHPDAWQWSGHTRARPRRAARFRWAGGAPAQRPARPAWRAWAGRPRGESSISERDSRLS